MDSKTTVLGRCGWDEKGALYALIVDPRNHTLVIYPWSVYYIILHASEATKQGIVFVGVCPRLCQSWRTSDQRL